MVFGGEEVFPDRVLTNAATFSGSLVTEEKGVEAVEGLGGGGVGGFGDGVGLGEGVELEGVAGLGEGAIRFVVAEDFAPGFQVGGPLNAQDGVLLEG